jgi:hypothetical protein
MYVFVDKTGILTIKNAIFGTWHFLSLLSIIVEVVQLLCGNTQRIICCAFGLPRKNFKLTNFPHG